MTTRPELGLLTQIAMQAIGTPYKWGGQNLSEGFDCSGFARYLLRSVGELPFEDLTAQGIHDYLVGHSGGPCAPCEGAFVFFGKSDRAINHIAFVVTAALMVEAFGDSTVRGPEDVPRFKDHEGATVRMHPINRRLDLVACLRPVYRVFGEG